MARRGCFFSVFLLFFAATWQLSASSLSKVMAQTENLTGIFMLIDGGTYTLNFTEASAACVFLNVTIATKAQMEDALQHGLEICKYGWVAEKIAVVPRIKADNNCGAGKTGLVTWNASADRPFAAFCFNASALTDQNQASKPTTASPQSSRSSTSLEALSPTSTSAGPTFRSPTQSPPSGEKPATPGLAKQAPSASPPLTGTTDSSSSSSSSSSSLPSHIPVSPHLLITSIPIAVTSGFSTSTQSPVSLEPGQQPSVSSSHLLLDAAHITLISLSIILLLLTAVTAWWCYKSNNVRRCVRRHKDEMQTEMWRNGHDETDLHSDDGAEMELEEPSVKSSSDVTLCVNPCVEARSLE
ncbi:lymphatic vessel endothelial hyaluronic receptor 1b [Fundulus heteroclitus]|uniref:lymphatic vessel endothelial hyaluronic receptor 1b n=1 Tax=Fundulus heteroclitus TaxID=8078 RepID=UPI00165B1550|nr:lymphatic vessel endothelial hyaluronic receptor 1b [Fundulus heteroclitus]